MNRLLTIAILTAATAILLPAIAETPEIDPGTGTAAFTFLTGAAMLIRARARR